MHVLININLSYILLLSSNYFIILNTSISLAYVVLSSNSNSYIFSDVMQKSLELILLNRHICI